MSGIRASVNKNAHIMILYLLRSGMRKMIKTCSIYADNILLLEAPRLCNSGCRSFKESGESYRSKLLVINNLLLW